MRQTARAARAIGDVIIVVNAWQDDAGLDYAQQYPFASFGKPYRDPDGNLVVPLSPSFLSRLVMLPLLLLQIKFLANTGNGILRKAFFPFVLAGCGPKVFALCKRAVLVHSFEGNYLGALAQRAAARFKIPFVIMPFMHPGSWGDDEFNRTLYRRSDAVLTACEYEKAWFEKIGVAPETIAAVGGYPEARSKVPTRAMLGVAGPLVLFYGRREVYKGYGLVLDAWKTARSVDSSWWLALVGTGFDKSINAEERIATLPAPEGSPLADCDIFCMPSKSETFGLVYVEAWSYERPVIACDIPSSRELFHGENSGVIVKFDTAEVSAALVRLMRDASLRTNMGAAGKKLVDLHYGKELYEENVNRVYRRVLNNTGRSVRRTSGCN
jgi:glycosyltransferase involved in cell wall biosynthesis